MPARLIEKKHGEACENWKKSGGGGLLRACHKPLCDDFPEWLQNPQRQSEYFPQAGTELPPAMRRALRGWFVPLQAAGAFRAVRENGKRMADHERLS